MTGCSALNFSVEGLINAPKLTSEQSEIHQALIESVGSNITLKYPKNGEYRSAYVIANIDDEPTDEAMVFYEYTSNGSEEDGLRVNILDKDEDGNVTGTTNVSFAISFNTARFENADQINAFGGKNGVLSGLHYKKQNLLMIGTVKNDLLGALQSAAANTNEAIQVHEVVKGPAYTIFMLADSRFWGYVDVASTSLGNGIEAYGIHVMW